MVARPNRAIAPRGDNGATQPIVARDKIETGPGDRCAVWRLTARATTRDRPDQLDNLANRLNMGPLTPEDPVTMPPPQDNPARLTRRTLLAASGAIGTGLAATDLSQSHTTPGEASLMQSPPAATPMTGTPAATPIATPVSTAGLTGPTNLDYRGVTLLPSRFLTQIDASKAFLGGELSIDTILRGFRVRAGQPNAPGEPLDGWARRTTEATFGQWVSSLARLGRARNDPTLTQRAIDLIDGWSETVAGGNVNAGTYGYEKYTLGLVDAAHYAGHAPAMDKLLEITRWASATFDRSRSAATPTDRDGRRPNGTLEWYTLAEQAYRAFQMTGNQEFRDFAALWHYDAWWDHFLDAPEPGGTWQVPTLLHAYSHVNTFASAAMAYEVTGDERFLTIVRNAARWVRETQSFATGLYGPGEYSVPHDGTLGRSIEWRSDTVEVGCSTWAGFKLSGYLSRFTGEAHYADWSERLLYNGIGAALPVQVDGNHTYYGDYRVGNASTKLFHWDHWACCSGTYFQDLAYVYDAIYLLDQYGPLVSLFIPSELRFEHAGQPVTLRQETLFPQRDTTTLTVDAPAPVDMALRLRVPGWSRGMGFALNDEAIEVVATAGEWATIERTWNPGDELVVTLGAGLQVESVDAWHPDRVALLFGPVVLAQESIFTMPLQLGADRSSAALDAMFTRADEGAGPAGRMKFEPVDRGAAEQPIGDFRPLMDYGERTPHRVYHDVDTPRYL